MIRNFVDSIRRRAWVFVAVAGAIVGFTAIANAAIPDSAGIIHACYANNNGDLRVVDDPATCKNNEIALQWGKTGPQGPQGVPGPQGPQGVQGPQGNPGTNGEAWFARSGAPTTEDDIVELTNLPGPASYVVHAIGVVTGDHAGLSMTCHIVVNGTINVIPSGYTAIYSDKSGTFGTAQWTTAVNLPAASNTIVLHCHSDDSDEEKHGELLATRIDVHFQ